MAMLYVKCPQTGKPTSTGVDVPKIENRDDLPRFYGNSVQCRHCGQAHTWNSWNCFFLDEEEKGKN